MPAGYRASLAVFDPTAAKTLIGALVSASAASGFNAMFLSQIGAWQEQIEILGACRDVLMCDHPAAADWHLLLEYEIPRRANRPDAVILAHDVIFVVEFKVGAETFEAADKWQVEAYARDLRDFHAESAGRIVVPVLVATQATARAGNNCDADGESSRVALADSNSLPAAILHRYGESHDVASPPVDAERWDRSPYRPTLGILESAELLFTNHDVREIAHCYADNLGETTDCLVQAIHTAQRERRRTICFVTGVPGAGKTLAGLNTAHHAELRQGDRPAGVFLSGNVPLVKVVRAALARCAVAGGSSRPEADRRAKTYIQDVHRFLADAAQHEAAPPYERVVIFDEAQRAWDAEKCAKKKRAEVSEAESMLRCMARWPDWCVIIALVGGGQEIHDGEAGLAEWGRALAKSEFQWDVLAAPSVIEDRNGNSAFRLFAENVSSNVRVAVQPALHLGVTVRSYRAQAFSEWVELVLQGDAAAAKRVLARITDFPVAFTRDLAAARSWLRRYCPLDRRRGLVATSGSTRLRAYGLELSSAFRNGFQYEHWFLNDHADFRSSSCLEVALSEFEIQGLELDYVGLCWGNDFWRDAYAWAFSKIVGANWRPERNPRTREFIRNKYRVLLTRAREGLVICVPRGISGDPTLEPSSFDATAAFLAAAGVPQIPSANTG